MLSLTNSKFLHSGMVWTAQRSAADFIYSNTPFEWCQKWLDLLMKYNCIIQSHNIVINFPQDYMALHLRRMFRHNIICLLSSFTLVSIYLLAVVSFTKQQFCFSIPGIAKSVQYLIWTFGKELLNCEVKHWLKIKYVFQWKQLNSFK